MILFALDSAGKTAGVAVCKDGILLYETFLATGHTHSETLLQLCADAFKATNLTPQDVDLFALTSGPGSFTGLRIGLAAIKGMAFAADTPCAGVSTLEALAYSVCTDGIIACALDARRGEVYCALFRKQGDVITRLMPDGAMPAKDFCALALQYGEHVTLLGDGAHLVHAIAPENNLLTLYPQAYRCGRAYGICLAAERMAQEGETVSPANLLPTYHRLSQAERERALRQNKGV